METKDLNKISIKQYLAEMNIHPVTDKGYYGMYHSPLREDHNASFKVDYINPTLIYSYFVSLVYGKGRFQKS